MEVSGTDFHTQQEGGYKRKPGLSCDETGMPVYKMGSNYLYYYPQLGLWMISDDFCSTTVSMYVSYYRFTPDGSQDDWMEYNPNDGEFQPNPKLSVDCTGKSCISVLRRRVYRPVAVFLTNHVL